MVGKFLYITSILMCFQFPPPTGDNTIFTNYQLEQIAQLKNPMVNSNRQDMFFEDNDLMQIPAPSNSVPYNSQGIEDPDSPAKKLTDLLTNSSKMTHHLAYERTPSHPNSPSPLSPAYSASAPSGLFYHPSYLSHNQHHLPQAHSPANAPSTSNAIYINRGSMSTNEFSLTVPDPSYLSRTYTSRAAKKAIAGAPPIMGRPRKRSTTGRRMGLKGCSSGGASPAAVISQSTDLQNLDERDELNLPDSANSSLKRGACSQSVNDNIQKALANNETTTTFKKEAKLI